MRYGIKYLIEKNIPLPGRGGGGRTAVLRSMEPGDSLACDLVEAETLMITARKMFGSGCCARRKQADGTYRFWLLNKGAQAGSVVPMGASRRAA